MSNPELLHDYWHPVALSSAVDTAPLGVTLLDREIVLWRSSEGVKAWKDLCIHRGTRLSLGWVEKDQLLCPYHGWCYGKGGQVTRIPAVPADRPIPTKARAETYHCMERYGLIFVSLGTPKQPIYEVPEFEDAAYRRHIVGPIYWNSGAARSFENFFDEAHLPWAHPGALGDRNNPPVIPSRDVKVTSNSFYFEYNSECQSRLDPSKITTNLLTYDIVLPFTLYHEHVNPERERVIDLFFCTPITKNKSMRFMVVARNFALDQPPDRFIAFTTNVWEQDRVLVESQRPEQLPIDWNAELHVRGPDGPSVTYRKLLAEVGITAEV
jgi:phenylpropionate dioxygenase-like ring-hydroxylating dioxygenase large terminal subunit